MNWALFLPIGRALIYCVIFTYMLIGGQLFVLENVSADRGKILLQQAGMLFSGGITRQIWGETPEFPILDQGVAGLPDPQSAIPMPGAAFQPTPDANVLTSFLPPKGIVTEAPTPPLTKIHYYHTQNTTETIHRLESDQRNNFQLTSHKNRLGEVKYNSLTRVTSLTAAEDVSRLTSIPATRAEFRPANTTNGNFKFSTNGISTYHESSSLFISKYRSDSGSVLIASPCYINCDTQPRTLRHSPTRICPILPLA